MKNKIGFALLFFVFLLLWILLAGISLDEIIAGSFTSFIVTVFSYRFFTWHRRDYHRRLFWMFAYIPYYLYREVYAHLDTIYRILSGNIRPSVVEVGHIMRSDFGTTALANSITLTPGTLTLDLKEKGLYVHWLNTKMDRMNIVEGFQKRLKRIWD